MQIKYFILNIVLDISYIVCVTKAAMYFNNARLLWWYLLVLLIGYNVRFSNNEKHTGI